MTDPTEEYAFPTDALLNYQQADKDGIMALVSRQAIHEAVAAWNKHRPTEDRLRAERDALDVEKLALFEMVRKAEAKMGVAVEALHLFDAYNALPADRGGKNGHKGKAFQAFIDMKNQALATITDTNEEDE